MIWVAAWWCWGPADRQGLINCGLPSPRPPATVAHAQKTACHGGAPELCSFIIILWVSFKKKEWPRPWTPPTFSKEWWPLSQPTPSLRVKKTVSSPLRTPCIVSRTTVLVGAGLQPTPKSRISSQHHVYRRPVMWCGDCARQTFFCGWSQPCPADFFNHLRMIIST